MAKFFNPTSTPTDEPVFGSSWISCSTSRETKYFPEALRRIVAFKMRPRPALSWRNAPTSARKFELAADNRDLGKLVLLLDIGLVGLDGMALRFESRPFVLLLEEAVIRIGQVFDTRLKRMAIDFFQPVELLLQHRDFFRTRTVRQSFACRFIRLIPLR